MPQQEPSLLEIKSRAKPFASMLEELLHGSVDYETQRARSLEWRNDDLSLPILIMACRPVNRSAKERFIMEALARELQNV